MYRVGKRTGKYVTTFTYNGLLYADQVESVVMESILWKWAEAASLQGLQRSALPYEGYEYEGKSETALQLSMGVSKKRGSKRFKELAGSTSTDGVFKLLLCKGYIFFILKRNFQHFQYEHRRTRRLGFFELARASVDLGAVPGCVEQRLQGLVHGRDARASGQHGDGGFAKGISPLLDIALHGRRVYSGCYQCATPRQVAELRET